VGRGSELLAEREARAQREADRQPSVGRRNLIAKAGRSAKGFSAIGSAWSGPRVGQPIETVGPDHEMQARARRVAGAASAIFCPRTTLSPGATLADPRLR
jgi:hypothetical protein